MATVLTQTDHPVRTSYLIVNFKFLYHPQLHEHPESGCDHGVNIKREVIKMDVIDGKFWHQRDVGCLQNRGHKSSQVHQLFQTPHLALLSCLSDMPHKSDLTCTYTPRQLNSELEMSFVSQLQMPQANEGGGGGGGGGRKLIWRKNIHSGSHLQNLEYKTVSFTENCSHTIYSDAYYIALNTRNIWAASSCEF